jgi:hypothetical protein
VENGQYRFLWLRLGFKINTTTDVSSFQGIKVSREGYMEGETGRREGRGEKELEKEG